MVALCQGPQVAAEPACSQVQTPPPTPEAEEKKTKIPKTPKSPKTPRAPKTSREPKAPKQAKRSKEPREPKPPKAPRTSKPSKIPKEPREQKEPKAPRIRLPGQRGPGRPRKVLRTSAPVWYCCACQSGPWLEPTTPSCIECCHATCDGCIVTDVMPQHYYEVAIMQ